MKVSKFTITLLILTIAAYFVNDNIIYSKVKNLINVMSGLTNAVERENVEIKKITNEVFEKQKELEDVKTQLEGIKKELGTLKTKQENTKK